LENDPAAMQFNVTWIGFWFNIPGVTLDRTKVVNDFFAAGSDVVISGIDTPEAIIEAAKARAAARMCTHYRTTSKKRVPKGEDACLGVADFNWGSRLRRSSMMSRLGHGSKVGSGLSRSGQTSITSKRSGIGFNKGKALSGRQCQPNSMPSL
jgi:simple sugar transport system substrate-binding protein